MCLSIAKVNEHVVSWIFSAVAGFKVN